MGYRNPMKIMNLFKRFGRGPLPLVLGGAGLLMMWAGANLLMVFSQPVQDPRAPHLQEKLETAGFYMLEEIEDQGARPDRAFDPVSARARADRFYEIYHKAIPAINAAAAGLPEAEEALVRAHEWMARVDGLRKDITPVSTEQDCKTAEAGWRANGSQAVVEFRLAALGLRSIPADALAAERKKRITGLFVVLAMAAAIGVTAGSAFLVKEREKVAESRPQRRPPNPPMPSRVETSAAIAVEFTREAILTLDPTLRILSINPAAETLFGYRSAELMGANLHALLPTLALRGELPVDASVAPSFEAARHQSGKTLQVELSLHSVNRQGRRTVIAIAREAAKAVAADSGEIPEASVVADLAKFCPAPLVIYDTEGCIVHVNEAFTETMAAEFNQVHSRPYWRIFLDGETAENARREWLLLAALNLPDSIEQNWRTLDGRSASMTWARSALRDNEGRVRFVIAIGALNEIQARGRSKAA